MIVYFHFPYQDVILQQQSINEWFIKSKDFKRLQAVIVEWAPNSTCVEWDKIDHDHNVT